MRYLLLLALVACGRTDLFVEPAEKESAVVPTLVVEAPCEIINASILYRAQSREACGVSGIDMTNRQFEALARAHPSCRAFQFRSAWILDCAEADVVPAGAAPDKCGWSTPQSTCL